MVSQQLVTLFNSMETMICIKDFNSCYRFINRKALEVLSYDNFKEIELITEHEVVSHAICPSNHHTHQEYTNHFVSQDERAYRKEHFTIIDAHTYNGIPHFLLTRRQPYYNAKQKITGVLFQSMEILNPTPHYIQQLLSNPLIEMSKFSEFTIEKHFNITLSTYNLTKSEKLCLHYVAQGKTAKEIAATLYKSVRTIESHLDNARSKLRCSNRSEVIAKAITEGLITYN